ncbi:MATE family efflux transporter [Candidatus Epulonipiscium viviparus]|uniref:MATE family efflux transporter n=1 Tax=Candidatus Epulonipiscium viviparus TaxID=420336 RepID=UPI00273810D4|nr:MATE family efflux transporter [Candidatus Epulopiscium viviparus]
MIKENIFKLWLRFVIPSIVGVVLNTIYTMVDGIFVGRGAGETALAALNLAWPAITIILGTGAMFGTGATILIAKKMGSGEKDDAERVFAVTIKYTLILGIVFMILGVALANPITKMLGATADTFDFTRDYFVVIYLMSIPYLFSNSLNQLVRADGNPNLSMIMVGVGALLNVVLDWLLVVELQMGTAGAALATGCGVILSTIIGLYYFTYGKSNLKLRRKYFKLDAAILRSTCKIGVASFFMQFSIGLLILIQNRIIYKTGTTVDIAIFSISGYTFSLYAQIAIGIVQGIQPVMAFHYGAHALKRQHQLLAITLAVTLSISMLYLLFLIFYGKEFVSLYNLDEAVIETAYRRILIFCMGTPAVGVIQTMASYYQAVNRSTYASIISMGRGIVLQVLFTITLPLFLGVDGIFVGQAASDICSLFIVGALIIHSRKAKPAVA